MNVYKTHYLSGIIITVFVGVHLLNHTYAVLGAHRHIEIMQSLRLFYRNIFVETILVSAVALQIISGFKLFKTARKTATTAFDRLHIYTGFYLAVFFIIHICAVMAGRFILKLDTNFYFGVAGLNTFPLNLFFIPYYALAILSVFGHIASIHHKKMKRAILGLSPGTQSIVIFTIGVIWTIVIFYGLTNGFAGVPIPNEYNMQLSK